MIIHWNLEVCPISGCQISWTHLLSQTRRCWHCMGLHQSSNPQVLSAMTLAGLGEALAKSLDAILQGCPQRRPWFSSWLPFRAAKDRAGHGKKCQSTTSAAWTGKSTWRILKPWCFAPESWLFVGFCRISDRGRQFWRQSRPAFHLRRSRVCRTQPRKAAQNCPWSLLNRTPVGTFHAVQTRSSTEASERQMRKTALVRRRRSSKRRCWVNVCNFTGQRWSVLQICQAAWKCLSQP